MSLTEQFRAASAPPTFHKPKRKRLPPFSIRLNEAERQKLLAEARGIPLGTYIKVKALGDSSPAHRYASSVHDRETLARVLAALGKSRLASNINQLARLANSGALPLTLEVVEELRSGLRDIHAIRIALVAALGLKPEGAAR